MKSKCFIHKHDALDDFFIIDKELPDPYTYQKDIFTKPKLLGQPIDPMDLYPENKDLRFYKEIFTKRKLFVPGKGYFFYWYRSLEHAGNNAY